MNKGVDALRLLISIAVCFIAAFIGSYFTTPRIQTWYSTINKPFFNPPNWIFGPVWSILFLLMGISLFLVWRKAEGKGNTAITLFLAQLVFNVLWSVSFFGFESPLLGFLVIIVLWALILGTIVSFARISRLAAYLQIPYILWVSFAAVLNLSLLLLNI